MALPFISTNAFNCWVLLAVVGKPGPISHPATQRGKSVCTTPGLFTETSRKRWMGAEQSKLGRSGCSVSSLWCIHGKNWRISKISLEKADHLETSKGGGHAESYTDTKPPTHTPTPDPPPPDSGTQVREGGGGGSKSKNSLGDHFLSKNNDFTRG